MSIGRLIREARQRKGLRIRDVADQLHISVSYMSEIERGGRSMAGMSARRLVRWAQAVGMDEALLLRHALDERLCGLVVKIEGVEWDL